MRGNFLRQLSTAAQLSGRNLEGTSNAVGSAATRGQRAGRDRV